MQIDASKEEVLGQVAQDGRSRVDHGFDDHSAIPKRQTPLES